MLWPQVLSLIEVGRGTMYPSGDSLQTTAQHSLGSGQVTMYPSGDSLQTTARFAGDSAD